MPYIFTDSYTFSGTWSALQKRVEFSEETKTWVRENTTEADPDVYLDSNDEGDIYLANAVDSCLTCQQIIVPAPFILVEGSGIGADTVSHFLCLDCALRLSLALASELQNLDFADIVKIQVLPLKLNT